MRRSSETSHVEVPATDESMTTALPVRATAQMVEQLLAAVLPRPLRSSSSTMRGSTMHPFGPGGRNNAERGWSSGEMRHQPGLFARVAATGARSFPAADSHASVMPCDCSLRPNDVGDRPPGGGPYPPGTSGVLCRRRSQAPPGADGAVVQMAGSPCTRTRRRSWAGCSHQRARPLVLATEQLEADAAADAELADFLVR
jgi:hypothetical protein